VYPAGTKKGASIRTSEKVRPCHLGSRSRTVQYETSGQQNDLKRGETKMKTSKLVLGTLVLAAAGLPAHAQKMVGAGTQHQTASSQMAMIAPSARSMATAALAPRAATVTPAALAASLPMTRNASPVAMISIKRAPKFETHTVYQYPKHALLPVRMNLFPAANYVGASVRFQLNVGTFIAPNYTTPSVRFQVAQGLFPLPNFVAPSVKFHVTSGGFPLPNYVAPSVKFQVSDAGFVAPNFVAPSMKFQVTDGGFAGPSYVSPSMSLQIASAEFSLPVQAGGPAEWSK